MSTTASLPMYLSNPSAEAAAAAGTVPLKETEAAPMMMDASMIDSFTSMRDDSDGFLFYDDDDDDDSDMTDSSDEDDSDEDNSDDEDCSESGSDSDASLDHGDDDADNDDPVVVSATGLRTGMQKIRSANSLRSLMSATTLGNGSILGGSNGSSADAVRQRMMEHSQRRRERGGVQRSSSSNSKARGHRPAYNTSISIGNMAALAQQQAAIDRAASKQSTLRETSSLGNMKTIQRISAQSSLSRNVDDGAIKPDEHLAKLLGDKPTFPYDDSALVGFFLETRPEYIEAWTNDITKAVRDHNLKALQQIHAQGQRLQACNQFGESIVHLCVRRGTPEILRFLLQDAGVSMRVCCENGRTPMHDAAWCLSDSPASYQMMMILLAESPMQLHITDKRGHTPLSYVPRARWNQCNEFLTKQHNKGRLN